MGSLSASTAGRWLPREAMREAKNPSPARDKVGLFVRDKFVCIEVNLNRGISLLCVCGQPWEVPESIASSRPAWLLQCCGFSVGRVHVESHRHQTVNYDGPSSAPFLSFPRCSFPRMFPQICKKCRPKREKLKCLSLSNDIKSHWSVFVILILRLWSVSSCEWEIKIFLRFD